MASPTPLSAPDAALIEAAAAALARIPPNDAGDHTVAAAARSTLSDQMFVGANVYHFTGGPCAELVVLGTAAAGGVLASDLTAMVAVRKNRISGETQVLNPCGRCRQVLLDYNPKIDVIVRDERGDIGVRKVLDLLPLAYVYGDHDGAA